MSLHEELFSSELESLRIENTGLKIQLAEKDERLKNYKDENDRLHEIIREFKRQIYGKKSERWESPEQLLFNEAEVLAKSEKPEDDLEVQPESKPSTPKPRGKRKPLPKELPREIVVVELPEDQRLGAKGLPLKPIGKEISEKLVFEPAQMKVVEYHRIRYGEDSGDTGVIAPPVPRSFRRASSRRDFSPGSFFRSTAMGCRFTGKRRCTLAWVWISPAVRWRVG